MRIRSGLLFWGLFFILLGGLPLLVRAGALDPNAFSDAWRLWPLLLVAFGVAMIFGRSRAGILATVLAAVALGIAAGGMLASGTTWIGNVGGCGALGSGTDQRFEDAGTFSQPITATFDLDCGSIDLSVAPGDAWRVQADYQGEPPTLELSDQEIGLRSPGGFGLRRQAWTVTLPGHHVQSIELSANAGSSMVRLAGAQLTKFKLDLNAGDGRVDATGAGIEHLDVSTNAGRARLLVDSDTSGSLSANAGSLELCVPADATLRFRVDEQLTFAHNLDDRGLAQSGDVWTREGAVGAPVIDLSIEGNAANFSLDPEGGC
jgi:cell wall-active antibiotic response 4TMS protein YvqF